MRARQIEKQSRRTAAPSSREASQEPGRGREATSPTEIPAKGWKDILWRVYEEVNKDRILAVAAGVTFYGLLALFPALAALVSIYGLFADPATIQDHLNLLSGVLPAAHRLSTPCAISSWRSTQPISRRPFGATRVVCTTGLPGRAYARLPWTGRPCGTVSTTCMTRPPLMC